VGNQFPERPPLRGVQVWILRLGFICWPVVLLVALFMRAWVAAGLGGGALAMNGTVWQTLTPEQRRQVLGRSH
jgi:hypothetical protein